MTEYELGPRVAFDSVCHYNVTGILTADLGGLTGVDGPVWEGVLSSECGRPATWHVQVIGDEGAPLHLSACDLHVSIARRLGREDPVMHQFHPGVCATSESFFVTPHAMHSADMEGTESYCVSRDGAVNAGYLDRENCG